MACLALQTGDRFLSSTLMHIDCQSQTIGSYGFMALAQPGSEVLVALTGLLTIFIAIFGIRILLGEPLSARSLVPMIIKIGIVLTLATSWPAWRVVGYNVVMNGPAEIAHAIGLASGLPEGDPNGSSASLQMIDDRIVAMTAYGTGRLTGGQAAGDGLGDSFQGIALADQFALGIGRTAYLTGAIAPYAITRLGAGILLAIAPLMAGLLLFTQASGIFFGWVRALAFCAVGNMALLILEGVQVSIMDPWLADVISRREAGFLTPSSPTELLVLGLAFFVLIIGVLAMTGRMAFHSLPWVDAARALVPGQLSAPQSYAASLPGSGADKASASRAYVIAQAVEHSMQREEANLLLHRYRLVGSGNEASSLQRGNGVHPVTGQTGEALGTSFRRTDRRASSAMRNRDSAR